MLLGPSPAKLDLEEVTRQTVRCMRVTGHLATRQSGVGCCHDLG